MIRIDVRIANKQNEKNLLTELEVEEVFNLIESNKDISKIAGKEDWKFTKGILKKWCINNSEDGKRVLLIALVKYKKIHTDTEKIIGFCTLTNKEADFLQNRDIELCHVIVDKNYRRILNGTKMVYNVIDIAFNLNYDSIYGRVFNDNEIGRSFIKHLNWTQIDIQDKECVWYVYKNKSERFSSIIFKRMLELDRMSIAQLSDLLGMSKQYIGSLKNPLVGQSTKLPSPQLLNQLCLILGQRSGAIFRQFYTDNKNVVKWKNFNEYLTSIEEDKGFNRLYENLDYEVINKILLSYAQLQRIESGFIFGESRIGLNEKEIIDNEFSNKNKETSRDDYEIWTLSDTLAEQLYKVRRIYNQKYFRL
jgi:ribosomal protein S18 acetylase RimI-like enzyme/transcriptional regulator with XRE-family HTH domain